VLTKQLSSPHAGPPFTMYLCRELIDLSPPEKLDGVRLCAAGDMHAEWLAYASAHLVAQLDEPRLSQKAHAIAAQARRQRSASMATAGYDQFGSVLNYIKVVN